MTGIGEAYCVPFHPHLVARMLEDVFGRYLRGQDPHDIESLWRRVYSAGYTQHPDLALMGVLSALEMACWDIIGKEAGQPVYKLLGGRVHERCAPTRTSMRVRAMRPRLPGPGPLGRARRRVPAQGFTALKFDPAGPYSAFDGRQLSLAALELCERFVRQLRERGRQQGGPAVRHARPDDRGRRHPARAPARALRSAVVRGAGAAGCARGDGARGARHAHPDRRRRAAGDQVRFRPLLRHGAAAILQMNLGRVGGLLEAKKIAGMAEVQHVQIAPHLYCGPVVGAANIQLATCSPNFLILEGIERWDGFHAQILRKPIRWSEGYVIPPTEPGLGVELNEEVALRHPYTEGKLHLEMADRPIIQP